MMRKEGDKISKLPVDQSFETSALQSSSEFKELENFSIEERKRLSETYQDFSNPDEGSLAQQVSAVNKMLHDIGKSESRTSSETKNASKRKPKQSGTEAKLPASSKPQSSPSDVNLTYHVQEDQKIEDSADKVCEDPLSDMKGIEDEAKDSSPEKTSTYQSVDSGPPKFDETYSTFSSEAEGELEKDRSDRDSATKALDKYLSKTGEKLHKGEHGAVVKLMISEKPTDKEIGAFIKGYRAHTFESAVEVERKLSDLKEINSKFGRQLHIFDRAIHNFSIDSHTLIDEFRNATEKFEQLYEPLLNVLKYEHHLLKSVEVPSSQTKNQQSKSSDETPVKFNTPGPDKKKSDEKVEVKENDEKKKLLIPKTELGTKAARASGEKLSGALARASKKKVKKVIRNKLELQTLVRSLELDVNKEIIYSINYDILNEKLNEVDVTDMEKFSNAVKTLPNFCSVLTNIIKSSVPIPIG